VELKPYSTNGRGFPLSRDNRHCLRKAHHSRTTACSGRTETYEGCNVEYIDSAVPAAWRPMATPLRRLRIPRERRAVVDLKAHRAIAAHLYRDQASNTSIVRSSRRDYDTRKCHHPRLRSLGYDQTLCVIATPRTRQRQWPVGQRE
jgi:hypothetical protein